MSTYVGPITNTIIDGIIKEINKKKTKEKIMTNVIDPLLCDLSVRYYPHFVTITIVLTVIIMLLIAILIILVINLNKQKNKT
jgi:hypothetical protein